MEPYLPLEMQLYILEMALPPQTLRCLPARRQVIKQFSLLHRDYTKPMQRLLYAIPHFDIIGSGTAAHIEAKFEAADSIEAVVTGLDLTVREWPRELQADVIKALASRKETIRELAVYLRAGDFPFFGEWLPNLVSLNFAGVLTEQLAQYPRITFPPTLTRLLLQRCGEVHRFMRGPGALPSTFALPPIPTLQTLLIGPRVSGTPGFDYSAAFPSLRILAIDRDSLGHLAPGSHDLSTLPSSLRHLRLEFPDSWTSTQALSYLLTVPQGLWSLEVYLGNPLSFSVPEELERRSGWMVGTKVRWTFWPEEPVDIEEWMPAR
ncbi:hypothetical protein JCM11251_001497 [Rhodosporidiobolus azoricus]